MDKNRIFIRTADATLKDAGLSTDLKRMLALMDGHSRSGDLAKRAPPSLRKKWDELVDELLEGGFIVDNPEPVAEPAIGQPPFSPRAIPVPPSGAAAPAKNFGNQNMPAAARSAAELARQKDEEAARARAEVAAAAAAAKMTSVAEARAKAEAEDKTEKAASARAELKAYFAAAKEKAKAEAKHAEQEAERARAELEAASKAAKARSDAEARARAEARRREEEAAQARAGLEAAAAKQRSEAEARAKAEAKQKEQEAAQARAALESAVAAAKVRSAALAKAKAEAKHRDEEAAHARVELEAAIQAAKVKADAEIWLGVGGKRTMDAAVPPVAAPEARPVLPDASEAQRLRDLEFENASLKKLLTEAYVELEMLKTSFGGGRLDPTH